MCNSKNLVADLKRGRTTTPETIEKWHDIVLDYRRVK